MYTTAEILTEKYGAQLLINLTIKEPTGDETEPDLAVINREIGRVDGIIDGYLRGGRYPLPLPEIPPELAGYAEDMAIARIYGCLPERTVPEDVVRAAKEAMAWLRDVGKGLAPLSIEFPPPAAAAGDEQGSTGFIKTSKSKSDRIFSDEKLNRFTGR